MAGSKRHNSATLARGSRIAALAAVLALAAAQSAVAAGGDARVVGGSETTIEEWPWQVAIADPNDSGNGFQRFFCGGSLVAPNVVITAAHCVWDFDSEGFDAPPSEFSAIAGRTRLSSNDGAEIGVAQYFYFVRGAGGEAVPEAQTPPGEGNALWDPDTFEWDAVVLQLAADAPPPAAPIAIAGPAERGAWEPGDPAFVTGWGTVFFGGPPSDNLREAQVEIIADETCGSDLIYGSSFRKETMVCAGFITGGGDTCQGDSGGPLAVPIGDGTFRLVGDTSWGVACAVPLNPGVYGRVADDPMRSALLAAIDLARGPGAADRSAPQTKITKHPRKHARKTKARFRFKADEPATFECKLDRLAYRPCLSPFTKKVRRKRHRFKVRAIDAAGNTDPTAAKFKWRVKRRRG